MSILVLQGAQSYLLGPWGHEQGLSFDLLSKILFHSLVGFVLKMLPSGVHPTRFHPFLVD